MNNGVRPIDNSQESKHVAGLGVRPLLLEAEEADQREQILLLHLLLLPPTPERKYRWIKIFSLFPPFCPQWTRIDKGTSFARPNLLILQDQHCHGPDRLVAENHRPARLTPRRRFDKVGFGI
jgi:hypothetical protein